MSVLMTEKKFEGTDFTDALKALKASDFTSEEPSEKEEISFTLHYKDDKLSGKMKLKYIDMMERIVL